MATEQSKPVIWAEGLNKSFGSEAVISDFSFTLDQGERLLLFAPSGSGKTTLLRILQGLLPADSGSYGIVPENERAMVFQEPRLFPYLTVTENLFLPLRDMPTADWQQAQHLANEWLALTGLEGYEDAYPKDLSGGMKRKVSLLRALITQPSLLILDEPFQSLDQTSREVFIETLFPQVPNLSILFTSHDLNDLAHFATSILLINYPRLVNPVRMKPADFVNRFPNRLVNKNTETPLSENEIRGDL